MMREDGKDKRGTKLRVARRVPAYGYTTGGPKGWTRECHTRGGGGGNQGEEVRGSPVERAVWVNKPRWARRDTAYGTAVGGPNGQPTALVGESALCTGEGVEYMKRTARTSFTRNDRETTPNTRGHRRAGWSRKGRTRRPHDGRQGTERGTGDGRHRADRAPACVRKGQHAGAPSARARSTTDTRTAGRRHIRGGRSTFRMPSRSTPSNPSITLLSTIDWLAERKKTGDNGGGGRQQYT